MERVYMLVDEQCCGNEQPNITLYKNKEDALNEFCNRVESYKKSFENDVSSIRIDPKLIGIEFNEEYEDDGEDEYSSGLPIATFQEFIIDYDENWHVYVVAKMLN